MIRQDYLLRIIQQVADAIARMLGATKREDYSEARAQAAEAYGLLGIPSELVLRMDSHALAGLFAQADKLRLLSKLLWQEGELLRAQRDPVNGLDRQRRAIEVLLEAQSMDPHPDDASDLREMLRHVPTTTLDSRYQRGFAEPPSDDSLV